ncbi:hypothetical protein KZZ07_26415 [Mameliella sp. CS4]|nr:hypothetical protein [Mameliella sp. CS4]
MTGSLFCEGNLEECIPALHPLCKLEAVVNDAPRSLDAEFDRLYWDERAFPFLRNA